MFQVLRLNASGGVQSGWGGGLSYGICSAADGPVRVDRKEGIWLEVPEVEARAWAAGGEVGLYGAEPWGGEAGGR